MTNFLKTSFRINEKNDHALLYLKGKVKHETPNEFGAETKTILKDSFKSSHPRPIKETGEKDIVLSDSFKFQAGCKVKIGKGVTIKTPLGTTIFDSLEFSGTPFEGDKIIFGSKKIKFTEWANNCINTCSKIIRIFEEKY